MRCGEVTRWELSKDFRRVHPDVYVRKGTDLDPRTRALAAGCWAKGRGILTGFSAAALHGVRWFAEEPAEVAVPTSYSPPGIIARQYEIGPEEIQILDGYLVTTPARTAFDLGRRLRSEPAIEALDALCNTTGLTVSDISDTAAHHKHFRGINALRSALPRIDPGAESPQETKSRLFLITAGFPRPTTQIPVELPTGRVFARLDMGWSEWKVAVEYDGTQHWTNPSQYAWDIDRQALLHSLGWTLIRVSATHLHHHPHKLLTRLTTALTAAGAPLSR